LMWWVGGRGYVSVEVVGRWRVEGDCESFEARWGESGIMCM
jgi:hypothetical protein